MQLHELHPKHKSKKRKRVGRGGKRGTYCGQGLKGQKARSGKRLKPAIREFIKRYPKLRGYNQKSTPTSVFGVEVNLDILEKRFGSDEKITPRILLEKGIVHRIKGRIPEVKILGKGEITKKLIIEDCQISKSARDKVEKAGGNINYRVPLAGRR